MTSVVDDAAAFAPESLAGFVAAEDGRVLAVPGGVVRGDERPQGEVAVVLGGGSGHFPAFAGWVGPGFGHGAACGGVFASPSDGQIVSVAHAADNGGGILFVPINYAGDILHFDAAARTLSDEGVLVQTVVVSDDIASGVHGDPVDRRGIAGAFFVVKVAGAAAAAGADLDEVARLAQAASTTTRSLGVAFSGCTLPGSDGPLFVVPEGRVAIGLGIHGEPGIDETPMGSAAEIADLLVDGLFAERPPVAGQRVAVLVNGLGATKYDELHLLYAHVEARLQEAGMTPVAPVVGEHMTSLDMAGASLSLAYLDAELEQFWLAPAEIYSFHRGASNRGPVRVIDAAEASTDCAVPVATMESQQSARVVADGLRVVLSGVAAAQDRLGRIDAVAGDGDHGVGMVRGLTAAAQAADEAVLRSAGTGTVLRRAGAAWSDVGGGTSGALWGSGLAAAADALDDIRSPNLDAIADAVRAFADAVATRGGASSGDKTMLDAILPFTQELDTQRTMGARLRDAWAAASDAAESAADATASIPARRGRARTHGDRSIGTPDAGAASFALIVQALLELR